MRGFYRYWILFVLFLFLPVLELNAQMLLLAKEHVAQLTIGPGFFSSDAGKDGVFQFYNPRISVGFNYSYRMHDRWAVRVGASYGLYGEKDGDWRPHRGWEVSTQLLDLSAGIQFFILKRNLSGACPDLYIAAGVGGLASINPQFKYNSGDKTRFYDLDKLKGQGVVTKQQYIDAWNLVHPSSTPRTVDKRENPDDPIRKDEKYVITPTFPISLGATWSIGRRFMLGIDYTIRVSTSDYLDNLNPVGSWYPDMYSSLSFSVAYILKTDCYTCYSALGSPKFKRTRASAGYWF